jgi:glucan phosphoethanolaminetransferase (alkaline phosphatase superfamily)
VNNYCFQLKVLVKRLLTCYLIYFFCRLVFFIANKSSFSSVNFPSFLADCFYGLRFDTFSILTSNGLFIFLSILPFTFFFKTSYQIFLKSIFVISNSLFLLANCIDIGYFPFTKKRASADLFNQIGGQTDLGKLLPQFLKDFWWIVLIYALMIVLIVKAYNRIKINRSANEEKPSSKQWLFICILFLLISSLAVIGIRGGLQRIPIDIVDAGGMVRPEEVPVILNTPFTLIKSFDKKGLAEYNFYDEKKLKEQFNPVHHFANLQFQKQNVVVIILESFAKEYTSLGKTTSYTPFLDSLMKNSLVFTNGYSNGSKSIEGIPAILSSLPSLMEDPVINSHYANNFQTSFASVLKPEGYNTAFFHGGINGTMNFDAYAILAGYDHYFGKNEYNNNADFDGFWGIRDGPFLQYSVKKMSEFKEPFHSAIFTLSSHHPYTIPEKYKGKFPKGSLTHIESLGYADYSLKQFFNAAKKTTWYNNTLFILSADHSSFSLHPFFGNVAGQKAIPIMFFRGDNSLKGINNNSISQIDILPSALNLLGYNKAFFSLGQSYLNRPNNNCFYYGSGTNFVVCDSLLFCYKGTDLYSVSNLKRDSLMKDNCLKKYPSLEKKMNGQFKAFIQTYNHTLISNSAIIK